MVMLSADRGFQVAHVLTAEDPVSLECNGGERRTEVHREAGGAHRLASGRPARGLHEHPAADRIGKACTPSTCRAGARAIPAKVNVRAAFRVVSANYLQAFGLRIITGRGFTRQDTANSRTSRRP
jgi:hypothetical protein